MHKGSLYLVPWTPCCPGLKKTGVLRLLITHKSCDALLKGKRCRTFSEVVSETLTTARSGSRRDEILVERHIGRTYLYTFVQESRRDSILVANVPPLFFLVP